MIEVVVDSKIPASVDSHEAGFTLLLLLLPPPLFTSSFHHHLLLSPPPPPPSSIPLGGLGQSPALLLLPAILLSIVV